MQPLILVVIKIECFEVMRALQLLMYLEMVVVCKLSKDTVDQLLFHSIIFK